MGKNGSDQDMQQNTRSSCIFLLQRNSSLCSLALAKGTILLRLNERESALEQPRERLLQTHAFLELISVLVEKIP